MEDLRKFLNETNESVRECLTESIPVKVLVPKKDLLRDVFPSRVTSDPILNMKQGKLINIVVLSLYIKSLLGEKKVSLKSLAKDYDRKDIYKYYEMIILDLKDYARSDDIYN